MLANSKSSAVFQADDPVGLIGERGGTAAAERQIAGQPGGAGAAV